MSSDVWFAVAMINLADESGALDMNARTYIELTPSVTVDSFPVYAPHLYSMHESRHGSDPFKVFVFRVTRPADTMEAAPSRDFDALATAKFLEALQQ